MKKKGIVENTDMNRLRRILGGIVSFCSKLALKALERRATWKTTGIILIQHGLAYVEMTIR